MTIHQARISVSAGDTLILDGEVHEIVERCDLPKGNDTFVVEHDGEETERHVDWFADEAAKADVIVIERGEA